MDNKKFTQEDKENVVEFLNIVAKNAKFNMDTQEIIKYYKLLSHMQLEILPKIESNILEILAVREAEESTEGSEE